MSIKTLEINDQNKKKRNASFELLRIICMFMILYYHLLIKVDGEWLASNAIMTSLTIPLHIAVICFVLISGYFGIKESYKKIISFFFQIIFYNVLAYFIYAISTENFNISFLIKAFLPITFNNDLWFIRTYFFFLLIVPILNCFIKYSPPQNVVNDTLSFFHIFILWNKGNRYVYSGW